jgi:hypothetical protein
MDRQTQPPRKRFPLQRYDFASYDDNLCLKPPVLLWLVVIYLARAAVIPFLGGVASSNGSADAASLTRGLFSPLDFAPAVIAVILPIAYLRRVPRASGFWRRLWSYGRWILASSAAADLAISLYRMMQTGMDESWRPQWQFLGCAVDVYIILYLLRSERLRDVFADFPTPP